ncbi:4-hydroxyphenylpyruvate dioxygenase [Micromonospora sp. KC721]|uniref:4-hydroxyphenylpyruvate dioxygenase n=1 Tax=Micromonospora sp. KC721 TaxID=2530380 RepID=UPI00104A758C|nr:4-hydroxyphenylpyruvate dioxygenase [Micromonospora sp. KC721]TDB81621.1 4-hydroxyphenylpyruvate dioxygenase [Micromonospora sp. KC721]
MSTAPTSVFGQLSLDHIEFYVSDLADETRRLVDGFGFAVYAGTDPTAPLEARSAGVGREEIRLVLTEPLVGDHPAAAYVEKHGSGVADISFGVADPATAFTEAVRRGARPVSPPRERDGVVQATVMGFGDVAHTFVRRTGDLDARHLPGLLPHHGAEPSWDSGLTAVDHFAVCLEPGQLDPTVQFYETVLDFRMIFEERIVVGAQAMNSKVVQDASGAVTLTLIEPDVSRSPGQIDEFLKNHGGAGVQHVAFTATDIVRAVREAGERGVEFLSTPDTYYAMLPQRLELARHTVTDLRDVNVLVDEDHHGQLFQIFTRSAHPRRTFFLEMVERLGARTFGSGNIKALYEAVEAQRQAERD